MQALDLSNYTTNIPVTPGVKPSGGRITDEMVTCWRENGFDHAIIGTQWPAVTLHQLEVCHRGGMSLDLYSYLIWNGDQVTYITSRNSLANGYNIKTHWIDCEDDTTGFTPEQIVDKISQAVDSVQVQEPAIYTAEWWWPGNTRSSHKFSHLKLWHASYFPNRIPDFSEFKRYGGWTSPTIWQYRGSVPLCGGNMDFNIVQDGYLQPEGSLPVANEELDKVRTENTLRAIREELILAMLTGGPSGGGKYIPIPTSNLHEVEWVAVVDGGISHFDPPVIIPLE